MASHRPYERLLQQAQRLTQRDEYWAGTIRLARMWVTPKKAPPYRPYIERVVDWIVEKLTVEQWSVSEIKAVLAQS